MSHSWDYGSSDSYNATSKTCRRCSLRGTSYGSGRTRSWTFWTPAGLYAGSSAKTPKCPGPGPVRAKEGGDGR